MVGKPSVVMDEGTDEKGAKGEAGAPDGSNAGLEAVVSDAGAVCAQTPDKCVTETIELRIISLNLSTSMAI
ncbi:hypothetical protein GCM10028809_44780 [Spirosoma gilvum]